MQKICCCFGVITGMIIYTPVLSLLSFTCVICISALYPVIICSQECQRQLITPPKDSIQLSSHFKKKMHSSSLSTRPNEILCLPLSFCVQKKILLLKNVLQNNRQVFDTVSTSGLQEVHGIYTASRVEMYISTTLVSKLHCTECVRAVRALTLCIALSSYGCWQIKRNK